MANSITMIIPNLRSYQSSEYVDEYAPLTMSGERMIKQKTPDKVCVSNDVFLLSRVKNRPLRHAIMLTVAHEENLIVVESQTPKIWGEGETLEEAIKSYEDFFMYDLKSYLNTPIEKMDFFARQELKLYKDLLNIP